MDVPLFDLFGVGRNSNTNAFNEMGKSKTFCVGL